MLPGEPCRRRLCRRVLLRGERYCTLPESRPRTTTGPNTLRVARSVRIERIPFYDSRQPAASSSVGRASAVTSRPERSDFDKNSIAELVAARPPGLPASKSICRITLVGVPVARSRESERQIGTVLRAEVDVDKGDVRPHSATRRIASALLVATPTTLIPSRSSRRRAASRNSVLSSTMKQRTLTLPGLQKTDFSALKLAGVLVQPREWTSCVGRDGPCAVVGRVNGSGPGLLGAGVARLARRLWTCSMRAAPTAGETSTLAQGERARGQWITTML